MNLETLNKSNSHIFSLTYSTNCTITTSTNKIITFNKDKVVDEITLPYTPLYSIHHKSSLITSTSTNKLLITDVESKATSYIDTLASGVEKINIYNNNTYIFGGWNKKVTIYQNTETSFYTKCKVYQSDVYGDTFIYASEKTIVAYDLRNYKNPFFVSENRKVINSIIMIDDKTFCSGCVDGKVKIENFSKNEKEFLYFNAHKSKQGVVYGVNWIDNVRDGLVSAGDDGNVILWNLKSKRREKSLYASEYPIYRFVIGDGIYTCEMRKDDSEVGFHNYLNYSNYLSSSLEEE